MRSHAIWLMAPLPIMVVVVIVWSRHCCDITAEFNRYDFALSELIRTHLRHPSNNTTERVTLIWTWFLDSTTDIHIASMMVVGKLDE